MTGIVTLTAILVAGMLVWRWDERKNAAPSEHNTITGTGADA
ncbi:hypothetical protein BJD62_gp59 [Gordonia phage Lucky10]|uniref:Uncharacterized protein n=1 Tax=Gordonia phage Lucky10 TaxID=1821557 RepID=A0A142KB19_9CAUD|nr:hypothetical protein BJD62_gp59 [Gordonia phage Lucky10]AMS03302.1 hypothetical protein SEA_LUCKY10_59 [Gordonia phage Lucky10]